MIERIGKTIYYALLPERVGYQKGWDELTTLEQERYKAVASRVVLEMSRPSPAMKQAAADIIGNYDIAHDALTKAAKAALNE
ncbi:hypothetical protein [Agrobacterium tumefaciens]|uniref:hypothetical protein n=1 Tax=Agrobacterium tumefaciens TaxID=358 RepID=UPI00046EE517